MLNIFTNGVFDLFHHGHEKFLWRAKHDPNDFLIVGVASDESNAKYKRIPYQSWETRAKRVSMHQNVDLIIKTEWSRDLDNDFYENFGIQRQVQGDDSSDFALAKSKNIFECIGREDDISTTSLLRILNGEVYGANEQTSMNSISILESSTNSVFIKKEYAQTLKGIGEIYIPPVRSFNEEIVLYELNRKYPAGVTSNGNLKFNLIKFSQPVCRLDDYTLVLKCENDSKVLGELNLKSLDLHEYASSSLFALSMIHAIPVEHGRRILGAAREDGLNRIKIQIQAIFGLLGTSLGNQARKFIDVRFSNDKNLVLLHGDFAPKNILVGKRHLTIIDFEECGIGDAALDIGYFFAELFLYCVNSQQLSHYENLEINEILDNYFCERADDSEWNESITKWFSIFIVSRINGVFERSNTVYKKKFQLLEFAIAVFNSCKNLEEAKLLIKCKRRD